MEAEGPVGVREGPGHVGADGTDGRAPADAEAGAVLQGIAEGSEGVARVVEHSRAPLFEDAQLVFEAPHEQGLAADDVARLVLLAQLLVAEAPHAPVAAREEAEPGGQLPK